MEEFEIVLNEDRETVNKIVYLLNKNEGYCPCSVSKNENTQCKCKEFRESKEEGYCHCKLYYKRKLNK